MLKPEDLLERFGDVARGTLLQQYGCTRKELAAAVDSGRIDRIRPGVFARRSLDRKVRSAAAHGGELTCTDALRAKRVWVLPDPDDTVHVWGGRADGLTRTPGATAPFTTPPAPRRSGWPRWRPPWFTPTAA